MNEGAPVFRKRMAFTLPGGWTIRTVTVRHRVPRPVVVITADAERLTLVPFDVLATEVYDRLLEPSCQPEDVVWYDESPGLRERFALVRLRAVHEERRYRYVASQDFFGTVPPDLSGWYVPEPYGMVEIEEEG